MSETDRYQAMPRAEWDGKAMLYSEATDRYYYDPEYAEADLDDGQTLADLRLVICRPNYVRRLDPDDYADELADDDGDLPNVLLEAIDAFNVAVAGTVLSWSPGNTALLLPEDKS